MIKTNDFAITCNVCAIVINLLEIIIVPKSNTPETSKDSKSMMSSFRLWRLKFVVGKDLPGRGCEGGEFALSFSRGKEKQTRQEKLALRNWWRGSKSRPEGSDDECDD